MGILKNFEFNKVNKEVEEEIKYLQLPNKIKYFTFWGSIIVATALSYNFVTSNLVSVSQKASLKKGDAPIVAFFETNWEKVAKEIKADYENDEKIFNEKNQLLRQINGESTSLNNSLNLFVSKLSEDDIVNIIKTSDDYKKMVLIENKIKLLSSKDEIVLNENSYKIVDILNKLATFDEAKKLEAIEEPVTKIVDLKIVDLNKDETKVLILEILNEKNPNDFLSNLRFKTADEMLKVAVTQAKRGSFEITLNSGLSLNGGIKLSLDSTKSELQKRYEVENSESIKKLEDSKNKVDSIKKEIEDLKTLQTKRIGFLNSVDNLSVDNYFEHKEQLKTLSNELEK